MRTLFNMIVFCKKNGLFVLWKLWEPLSIGEPTKIQIIGYMLY